MVGLCFWHLTALDECSTKFDHQVVRPDDVENSVRMRPHDQIDHSRGVKNVGVGEYPHESVLDPGINEVVHQYGYTLVCVAAIFIEFDKVRDCNQLVLASGLASRDKASV